MKGYLEKRLGLDKPEHVSPKTPGVMCPSADHAATSKCISLSSQLVWWPVETLTITPLATAAAVQSPGSRQAHLPGLVLSKPRAAIAATSFLTV